MLRIQGGGFVHAVHLNLTAGEMIVDDLGRVVGDTHSVPCVTGEGVNGAGASGKHKKSLMHKIFYTLVQK